MRKQQRTGTEQNRNRTGTEHHNTTTPQHHNTTPPQQHNLPEGKHNTGQQILRLQMSN